MDQWKPPTKEDREIKNRQYLQEIKRRWDRISQRLSLNIEEWKSDELLQQAAEAFLSGDTKAQAKTAERIRILISYTLLQKAITANNPDLQSSDAEPMGGRKIEEADIDYGKTKLHFFGGTSGERILVSSEGLRLPWVHDEKHYTRTTNMLLRETMKELFPDAEGSNDQDLTVSFHR